MKTPKMAADSISLSKIGQKYQTVYTSPISEIDSPKNARKVRMFGL